MSPSYVQLGSLSSLRSPRRFTAGRPRGPRHGGPGWDAPCLAVQDSEVPGPRGPDKAHPTLLQVPAPHSQRALCIQPALKGYTGATWPEREAGSSPRRPSTAWGAADAQEAFTALSGPTATMSVTGHLEKLPPGGSLTDVTASGELTARGGGVSSFYPPRSPSSYTSHVQYLKTMLIVSFLPVKQPKSPAGFLSYASQAAPPGLCPPRQRGSRREAALGEASRERAGPLTLHPPCRCEQPERVCSRPEACGHL